MGKKVPMQILYHNSALHYAVGLNFGKNSTSITLNSNWYIHFFYKNIITLAEPQCFNFFPDLSLNIFLRYSCFNRSVL